MYDKWLLSFSSSSFLSLNMNSDCSDQLPLWSRLIEALIWLLESPEHSLCLVAESKWSSADWGWESCSLNALRLPAVLQLQGRGSSHHFDFLGFRCKEVRPSWYILISSSSISPGATVSEDHLLLWTRYHQVTWCSAEMLTRKDYREEVPEENHGVLSSKENGIDPCETEIVKEG